MSNLISAAQPAVSQLMQSDEEQLYAELGLRTKLIESDPANAARFESDVEYAAAFAGPIDDLRDFGKRFYKRVSRDVYDLVCGSDAENEKARQSLMAAITSKGTFTATLTAVLIAQFGMAPAIAVVIATISVKLFFNNAYQVMCDMWKERLPQT